jgi:hypothetical protein
MPVNITKEDFLNAHKLNDKVYATGMFYSGITIYNQQVRTLNLIYFLIETGRIESPEKSKEIVILGGGISGLTASIAFKRLGYKVSLLEQKALLLHLQHGCSTRQIHPNLYLWPKVDSLKPFTELPFANWTASDASVIEKELIGQYETEKRKKNGKITNYYNVAEAIVDLNSRKINFTHSEKKRSSIKFSFLLLATGFGLEKFVGRKEQTKSYWRNEDLSQLLLKDQVAKFFISGVGDGGLSDVFRLALIAFDPIDWAKKFEIIENKKGRLIKHLRNIEEKNRNVSRYSYARDFEVIYKMFARQIKSVISKFKRTDVKRLILNGKEREFEANLMKGKMSFINAWIAFILKKQNLFEYHSGGFPDESGGFIFSDKDEDQYHLIVRHGTDRNMEDFKKLHKNFEGKSQQLARKQKQKRYNDFSTLTHWKLEFWTKTSRSYSAKKYIVSKELDSFCSVYLTTLDGIIRNFIETELGRRINFRATIHRLVCYSGHYHFQQVSKYVGTRTDGDVGRAFPIDQGMVGLAMRSNKCFSYVRQIRSRRLFNYEDIFARPLGSTIDCFLIIPIPLENNNGAALCLYLDTSEEELVKNKNFRRLVYWTLTSFVKQIDQLNVNENEVLNKVASNKILRNDVRILQNTPGLHIHNDEIGLFWKKGQLKMSSSRLIDKYAE